MPRIAGAAVAGRGTRGLGRAEGVATLLPFLFVLYVAAFLDRINVGFAQLQMKDALGFSDSVYGFGAGVSFIGYFIFEVPSNLILARTGARLRRGSFGGPSATTRTSSTVR